MSIMDKPAGDFVKYHRSLLDWEWYHDLPVRVLFLHLMLDVNWKPGRFEGHDIPPGSVPTSIDKLSAKSGLTRQSVRTALEKLKSTGEITIQATSRFSVVTLANWEKYQSSGKQSTRQSTQQSTGVQHASNTRSTSIEEGNKERREEQKERVALSFPSWSGEPFKIAWERWRVYKAEKGDRYKPVGEQAALSKIAKEYTNDSDFITAMEHSMGNGWKGIFKPHNAPVLKINGGMTREEAEAEMTAIRIAHGRDPVMGWVGDEECSRALLIYRGVIKERKAV